MDEFLHNCKTVTLRYFAGPSWPLLHLQGRDPLDSWGEALNMGLNLFALLLTCSLAIVAALVFAVRALMILRDLPVPSNPIDMVKPKAFRALMLGATFLLAPLVAFSLTQVVPSSRTHLNDASLAWAYGIELALILISWLVLNRFYRQRERHSGDH